MNPNVAKTCSLVAAASLLALPALAADPYAKPDDTWISLSGTVQGVVADAFTLDYGEGMITVEMDDGDRDADGYKLVDGDKVTVTGVIDDDFYLDAEDYQRIEVGDIVSVGGHLDGSDLWEDRKLVAESIIELVD